MTIVRWEYARFDWYHTTCRVLFSHTQPEGFVEEAERNFPGHLKEPATNEGLAFDSGKITTQEVLYFLGEYGWELVGVAKAEWDDITLFFKRPAEANG